MKTALMIKHWGSMVPETTGNIYKYKDSTSLGWCHMYGYRLQRRYSYRLNDLDRYFTLLVAR